VSNLDTEHRRLCHALFDAIEQGDLVAVEDCYAPDMTMWSNITAETSTREENLAGLATGYGLHRRRTYNDRMINTFDDGFVAQYTTSVVTHRGSTVALSVCLVAEVRDGLIVNLFEYLDSGKFASGRRSRR
jgi:ketosteroid isomerase-like protein